MRSSLTIGDFARATHMSVKTLRHYHRVGLLEPADVDAGTGYRYYTVDQIPTAQVIRRFRQLDMPLDDIHAVLAAPDVDTRNDLIAAHLNRLEGNLARTQNAVASLRDLLGSPSAPIDIQRRTVAETCAAAIQDVVDIGDSLPWFQGGRVLALTIPAVELATTIHNGPHVEVDRPYGALGAYVAEHTLGVEGPIREYYVVGQHETADQAQWRTEIGWPIFQTGKGA
jgi:DNA-binding transcriptional MerR regulator